MQALEHIPSPVLEGAAGRIQKPDRVFESEMANPLNINLGEIEAHQEEVSAVKHWGSFTPTTMSELLPTELITLVYACGAKFGIPTLNAAAAAKFADSLSESSKSASFAQAVKLVLETTALNDSELRCSLFLWCIEHLQDTSSTLEETMVKHEPVSRKLCLEATNRLQMQSASVQQIERMVQAK